MVDLPEFHLGWQLVDPGPPPRSRLLDQVPAERDPARLAAQHLQWVQACRADDTRLSAAHYASSVVWFPVLVSADHAVVPFYGGTAQTWQAAAATVTSALVMSGYERTRVVNLARHDGLGLLRQLSARNRRWSTIHGTVTASGSSVDPFMAATYGELANFAVDTLRMTADQQGRVDAGRTKQMLVDVAALLEPSHPTLGRLADAVSFAVSGAPPSGSVFSLNERAALTDYHAAVVRQRQGLADGLDRVERDLRVLKHFEGTPARAAATLGEGPDRVRLLEVGGTTTGYEFELGREVLARFVARAFSRPSSRKEALVLLGADHLSSDLLDQLVGSALRYQHRLILFFERIRGAGESMMGAGGSPLAIFFALQHPDDREWAARFIGRDFKFVVNGYSFSEGSSTEWSSTSTISSSNSVTRTKDFSRLFGASISRALGSDMAQATGTSGGQNWGQQLTVNRVDEYIVAPETFRSIPDMNMLVIRGKEVTVADCNPAIRPLPITSPAPYS